MNITTDIGNGRREYRAEVIDHGSKRNVTAEYRHPVYGWRKVHSYVSLHRLGALIGAPTRPGSSVVLEGAA